MLYLFQLKGEGDERMITIIGSINMDLVVNTQRAPEQGETVTGDDFHQIPGGKGANQAVAAARDGAATVMAGRVGNDAFGNILIETLGQDPIDTSFIEKVSDTSTGVAQIIVDQQGHNRIVVVPGANGCFTADDMDALRPLIARSNVLLLQLEIPLEAVERALVIAREERVFSILNPAPAVSLPSSIYQNADLMTPNETELLLLSDWPKQDTSAFDRAGAVLLERGLSTLVVTLGEQGSLLINNKGNARFTAYRVAMVDSTAAGDCFNGVLAAGIDRLIEARKDRLYPFIPSIDELAPIIDRATRAAAISVTRRGAQPSIPKAHETDAFDSWYEAHRV